MKSPHLSPSHSTALLAIFVLLMLISAVILPDFFRSRAVSGNPGKGLFTRTVSQDPGLPNYDIRMDKKAAEKMAGFRGRAKKNAAAVADIRERQVGGERALQNRVPGLKVEYNRDLQIPEVIAPDPQHGKAVMSQASNARRPDVLKGFLKQNKELVGASDEQVADLKVTADYTNPDGGLSFARLEQEINGIPVFRGEINAGFTRKGELFRVINNFAPGLEADSVSSNFGSPADAVRAAAGNIKHELDETELASFTQDQSGRKMKFGASDWAKTAEKMYFPTEPGIAIPAWRVLIWQPRNAYTVIVDAETGSVLWRKNLTEDQTQAATYYVYRNSNSMIDVADNPAPLTPGPVSPLLGTQGALLTRQPVTLIGNEAPNQFNTVGWITGPAVTTMGNNVVSGLDLVSPDGNEAGTSVTANAYVFDSTWNPPPGNPAPGDSPSSAQARKGAVIQQFYIMNRYHDEMYRLGFTEEALNFQNDNFGRGALGNDAVQAQGQDYNGTNNANFSTPPDGGAPRMQMYLWTNGRDGTADAEIMIHEATHGTSSRLHGNADGLFFDMARGMGEGWSDFYALAMLSEPGDAVDGVYGFGGYTLLNIGSMGTKNYYYGIRRFPKAIMSSKGGTNNRPHNPLTFADIDSTKDNLSDGAFAPAFIGKADAVHNAGEVWSSALWEIRALMITRLGWAEGNRKTLQFVTDGMKLAPLDPTFLTERDAIISTVLGTGTAADVADFWRGFAIRGMGASASIQNPGGFTPDGSGTETARVTEAFDRPNLTQVEFSINDQLGNNNGIAEPGESITFASSLANSTGHTATGVKLRVSGTRAVLYGTIAHKEARMGWVNYKIPVNLPCGSAHKVTFYAHSNLGMTTFERTIVLGTPVNTYSESFDGVTAPAFPAGWTAQSVASGPNWITTPRFSSGPANAAYAREPTSTGGGANLTSPLISISSESATLTFQHRFDTEANWDGGVLDISIDGGPFQDIKAAGGVFLKNGYNSWLLSGSTNSPLEGREAWSGYTFDYLETIVRLPAAASGKNVRFRWRFGSDDNTTGFGPNPGWYVDEIKVAGNSTCSFTP